MFHTRLSPPSCNINRLYNLERGKLLDEFFADNMMKYSPIIGLMAPSPKYRKVHQPEKYISIEIGRGPAWVQGPLYPFHHRNAFHYVLFRPYCKQQPVFVLHYPHAYPGRRPVPTRTPKICQDDVLWSISKYAVRDMFMVYSIPHYCGDTITSGDGETTKKHEIQYINCIAFHYWHAKTCHSS